MDEKKLLKWAHDHGPEFKSKDLAKHFKVSRQTAARWISELLDQEKLYKTGSTRSASYSHKKPSLSQQNNTPASYVLNKVTKNLEEDQVWNELATRANIKALVSKNSFQILSYAFTEMLNNAIDHSKSPKVEIELKISAKNVCFEIKDFGIGIFKKIKQDFKLKNEWEAIEHLLKGKQTSAPEAHSGQGIFFTSKIADTFSIRSEKIRLVITPKDTFTGEVKKTKGTLVTFTVSRQSRKKLSHLFKEFSDEDFEFTKGQLKVKMSQFEGLLSRSQAKRLLIGLENYNVIDFDFSDVKEIGQAFADQIFRIYKSNNPKKTLMYTNANEAVAFMIERSR